MGPLLLSCRLGFPADAGEEDVKILMNAEVVVDARQPVVVRVVNEGIVAAGIKPIAKLGDDADLAVRGVAWALATWIGRGFR